MNKIEAKFKIVTPMFISGADQTKAELRVPSIKGALRFWWRALNYEEDPTNLLKKESAIFGSTDGQSKIKMRLKDVNIPTTKISNKWNINDWRGYIGYGLSEDQSGKEKKSIYRTHINPGGKFSLIINSKEEINSLSDPLKLLSLLGGLGSRSRKGWGSIAIESIDNGWEIPKTRNEYKEQLGQIFVSTGVEELPRYSAISSESDVRVGPIFGDQNSAFEDIGLKYKQFLKELKLNQREGFGLPRKNVSNDRRSSPLLIHIHQIGKDFFWVCVFLKSNFNETNEEPREGYEHVEKFMKTVGGDMI